MTIDRRRLLQGLAPAVAFPYLLRSDPAHAAIKIRKIGKPVRIGGNQPGGQSRLVCSAFADGSFIAAWINGRDFSGDIRAYVQKWRRNGTPDSPAIQMSGGPTDGTVAINVVPVAFPDGTSLIVFSAARDDVNPNDAIDIFAQRMSASFEKIGAPISINKTRAGFQSSVFATRLKNGNLQLAWESQTPDLSATTVRGRIIKPNGRPVTPDRAMVRHSTGVCTPKALCPTTDGGSFLSYVRIVQGNAAGAKGPIPLEWQKAVQENGDDGAMLGQPDIFDTGTPARPFGGIGLPSWDPDNPADVVQASAWFLKFKPDGDRTEFRQVGLEGRPANRLIGRFTIEPSYQLAPPVMPLEVQGRKFFLSGFPKQPPNGNRFVGLALCDAANGDVVAEMAVEPDQPGLLTLGTLSNLVANAGMLDARAILSFNVGTNMLNDRAYIQQLAMGPP